MTKAPTETTTQQLDPQASGGWLQGLLVIIFRLLLLGIGSVTAVLVGIAIATVAPAETNRTPLLETLLQRGVAARQAMRQSPGAMLDALLGQTPSPIPEASAVSDLETEAALDAGPVIDASDSALRITLPSDVLFQNSPPEFTAQGSVILETVAQEIQQYPGATVQVAAYSDRASTVARNRQTAFEQAQIVQQYLADTLGDNLYHWVTMGYGKARQPSASAAASSEAESATAAPTETSAATAEPADTPTFHRIEISINLE